MKPALRIGAAVVATLLLLVPALWNGFPLLQYDTGGYIARWYEGTLEVSRSTVYGLFLNVLARPDFWPAVVVQAALTVWILRLVLRAHGFGHGVLVTTVAVLCVFTALPWVAGLLLTDIFFGLAVLALHLLLRRADALARWERIALFAVIGFAASTHSATLLVLLALLGAGLVVALYDRRLVPLAGLAAGVGAVALGVALLLAGNFVVAGRLAWTPGGAGILFGRMLQAGIVDRYLDDHCPDARLRLCDHRAEVSQDADTFFWGAGVFDRLGRFDGMHDELRTIALESLTAYPWLQLKTAAIATAQQLASVRTGAGVINTIWHTHGMIENFVPAALPAMRAARQFRNAIPFEAINLLHVPVAWMSMALLPAIVLLGFVRRGFADLGWLAATAAVAILANAFVCGALANPHDRYGARAAWLASFTLLLVPWRARRNAPEIA